MKKFIVLATALMFTLLGSTALAVDTDGKFGIGANASLSDSGVSGLGLNYWVGHLKVGVITGFEMQSPSEGDSTTKLDLGLQGLYAVARSKEANLNTGARLNFIDLVGPEGSDMAFGFEVPIEAEYWVTNHVTITAHVGLSIFMPKDNTIITLGAPGFNGGAGFNFYF